MSLAAGLRERAEAWQAARDARSPGRVVEGDLEGAPQALITVHLEVQATGAGLRAAAPAPGAPVAELRAHRGYNGSLELAVGALAKVSKS